MTTPKAGDRVRVEFEGTVDNPGQGGSRMRVAASAAEHADFAWVRPEHCTVIAPPVKVGDRVTSENVAHLPVGTVVLTCYNSVGQRLASGWYQVGWADHYSDTHIVGTRATVLHIPEASA